MSIMKKNYNCLSRKNNIIFIVIACSAVVASSVLLYSANHFYPKGSMYQTENIVCLNDDRGSCGKEYRENLNELQVPEWVKFFKGSGGFLIWFISIAACFVAFLNFKKIVELEQPLSNNKKQETTSDGSLSLIQKINNSTPEEKTKIIKEIEDYYGLSNEVVDGKNDKKSGRISS